MPDQSSPTAAGVLFVAGNTVLLLQRARGDHAGTWALPGGGIEDGETPEIAARRECVEELGTYVADGSYQNEFIHLTDHGGFATFLCVSSQFVPTLNEEHSGYVWAKIGDYPGNLHPNLAPLLVPEVIMPIIAKNVTELDVARCVRDGTLPSPTRFANVSLFAIRITGTGTAYRSKDKEFTYRRPENYLTPEFLARCNGLPVIFEHPEKAVLNSDEFADRVIGTILLPYIVDNEVWGIAKIYDDEAIEMMSTEQLSTSPTVVFHNLEESYTLELKNGDTLLIEGKPSLLDHVAVCALGVWDKGGEPSGVITNTLGVEMTEAEMKAKADAEAKEKEEAEAKAKADAEGGDKLDKLLACVDSLSKRMDAMENPGDTAKTAADKAKADAQAKADSDDSVKRAIADLESRLPKALSDADYKEMADAQAKADSVAMAFGDSAPRPLQGETPLAYRKRLVGAFKKHSKEYGAVDVLAIADATLFGIVESKIYADAMEIARNPIDVPAGQLREVITTDRGGRRIVNFAGDPSAWMTPFRSPKRRLAGINKGA